MPPCGWGGMLSSWKGPGFFATLPIEFSMNGRIPRPGPAISNGMVLPQTRERAEPSAASEREATLASDQSSAAGMAEAARAWRRAFFGPNSRCLTGSGHSCRGLRCQKFHFLSFSLVPNIFAAAGDGAKTVNHPHEG